MFDTEEIWQQTGIELYVKGYQGTKSVSFDKKDIRKVIQVLDYLPLSNLASGSGTTLGGTYITKRPKTILLTDYQGRKLSIMFKDVPRAIVALADWL